MNYVWNILNWVQQFFPPKLNRPIHVSWMDALIGPFIDKYNEFFAFRLAIEKKMRYNSQIIIFQSLLNDLYDPVNRRIYIETAYDINPPFYIYEKVENQPLYIYTKAENQPVYIYETAEYGVNSDFVVFAADGSLTAAQIIQLKASVNFYKFAGLKPRYEYYPSGNPF